MAREIDIDELAKAAMITLTESENEEAKARFLLLDVDFEALASVDTGEAAPLVYVTDLTDVFREDAVIKEFERDVILSNAPDHENGFYKVPRTID